MRSLILIAHNLRSTHNVGSLLRTADGLGVTRVFLTGYTPYPAHNNDDRLPHEAFKIDRQISKTALGAEKSVDWHHEREIHTVIQQLHDEDFFVAAVEQTPSSTLLPSFKPPEKLVLIVGREVEGIEPEVLEMCDITLEIPMLGSKESFNVVQASAMAMYHVRFADM